MTGASGMVSARPNSEQVMQVQDRLREGPPLLLDGATGTELNRRGVGTELPTWSAKALWEAPDVLRAVHRDYVLAGAEIITANTFRTHRRSLDAAGYADKANLLTHKAVELARAAIQDAVPGNGEKVHVAGSIAPLEDCYSPHLVPDSETLSVEHYEMAPALADAGADLLLVETMNTIREAAVAAEVAVATGLPVMVSFVCGRDGRLLSGESIPVAAGTLSSCGVDAILLNCVPAPDLSVGLSMLASATDLPIGGYGNVGYADNIDGWVITDSVDPQAYAIHAESWMDMGARIIGSCCGTGPGHTEELRARIAARKYCW
ncbi:MAG: homocysteine S-methyltransferase family protein [Acidobacteriota bacterium]|nr:homocysteine S-methyltransferase family protein [Acidobacteriota bacterium]